MSARFVKGVSPMPRSTHLAAPPSVVRSNSETPRPAATSLRAVIHALPAPVAEIATISKRACDSTGTSTGSRDHCSPSQWTIALSTAGPTAATKAPVRSPAS